MIRDVTYRKFQQIRSLLSTVLCGLVLFFAGFNTYAQTWPADTIHVNINTNDPTFPFPQFLEYKAGKSLAANNAEGVTHADMEKAMREAYQIMMHRAIYTGQTYNGVKYIKFSPLVVPGNPGGFFCSEGDGYALLAAAYFADKATFDGLWMWIHDNRLSAVKRYHNCVGLRPTYPHGSGMAGWDNDETAAIGAGNINSAADGDYDIAMALVIASKQWPAGMGINDACGNTISYKAEALKMVKVLVDTLYYSKDGNGSAANLKGYLSGDVGIDGYIKSGNTWDELTDWRYSAANTLFPWAKDHTDVASEDSKYVDYNSPAYFREFAIFLEENPGSTAWQISQYKRAAASGDWTIKQMYDKGYIASAGNYTVSDNGSVTTFASFSPGEDFRCSWRTILDYVWHGNPDSTWNPVTHQVVSGGNTFEYDMALRHKEFLKFPGNLPSTSANAFCGLLGSSPDPGQPKWKGVAQLQQQYLPNGTMQTDNGVNWMAGTGTPAAVASGDLDVTAELYRQCELVWDDVSGLATMPAYQRYIGSTPKYFHGWYRTLGMLTASGNLHAPEKMVKAANMKVYMDVDKTFAYEGDILNYEVSYRNYGSADATGVNIITTVDPSYKIVSAPGGVISGNTITWSIGTVPGFKTNALAATEGVRTFIVRVNPIPSAMIVCLTSTVTSSNAPTWTSNEYPNNATYTMERNCVDLLKDRVLAVTKTTDRSVMNPSDVVNFTLNFENKTGSNLWLNGGRDRVIVSYANYADNVGTGLDRNFYQFYRIWHTAHEAYINLGNYRVSYFMNDAAAIGEYNAGTNPTGWTATVDNDNDLLKYGYNPPTSPMKFTYQKIPWGQDANGSWNQRIVTQFAPVLSATSMHVYDKLNGDYLLHKGVVGPSIIRTLLRSNPSTVLMPRLIDDWSFSTGIKTSDQDGQEDSYYPVSPSFTNFNSAPKFAPVAVTNYSKDACGGPVQNFTKVLVEEFDGYTWRRVAGNGPLPGRETYNVIVTDSIPIELAWSAFTDDNAVGITATYTALPGNTKFSGYVKWSIPVMLTGETGNLSYKTIAKSPCAEKTFINAGWIWSDVDSPDSSAVNLRLTCNPVPPTPPIETSLVKTADKTNVVVGNVINYTLTFTNKDGSTASWAGASTALTDWQTLGTGVTIPKLNAAVISLDQNGGNNAPGANGYAFGPKKAHGVNGWMEATIAAANSSNLSFLYRYQSPNQNIRLEVSPNIGGNNNIAFYLYQNGSATPFVSLTGLAFPGSSSAIKIRTQLLNDKLYIWVNDFSGAPLKVISGITQLGAGYAGISANGSQQALSAYTAHFDSAFDLVFTDPVPIQLNNVTNISDAGALVGSTVTWPTIPGPILANAINVRTFTATVNTCTDFITNIGKASVYGVTNIQSQYVVTCGGSTPPCTLPTTPVITMNQTICTGTAPAQIGGAALAGGSATGTASYIWQTSIDGTTNWTAVSGATLKDYTHVALTASVYYRRIDSKGGCSSLPSNVITITVTPLAIAGTIATDQTICSGTAQVALTGTASTGGVTIKNYKWQSSTTGSAPWTRVAAYSPTGTGFAPGNLTATTHYRRIDSSGVCAGVQTNVIIITVDPAVTQATITSDQAICSASSPSQIGGPVVAGGSTTATATYVWEQSVSPFTAWTVISLEVSKDYQPPALTAETWYRRTDKKGACAGVVSTVVKITITTVAPASVILSQSPLGAICDGANVTFTASVGSGGTPTYVWTSSVNGILPSTTSTYSSAGLVNGEVIRVDITSSLGCANPNTATASSTMTVTPILAPSVSITVNDADRTICPNTSITFTAAPTAGGTPPGYVWKKNNVAIAPAETGSTYTTTGAVDGDIYTVEMVSSALCAPVTPVTSNPITITVTPVLTLTVTAASSSSMICSGQTITFTATPGGTGSTPTPTYEWFIGPAGFEVSTSTLNPFTTTSLTTTAALSPQTYSIYVRAVSTATCASTTPVQSTAITVVVDAGVGAGTITIATPTICYNSVPAAITEASAASGGSSPTYVWEESPNPADPLSWGPAQGTPTPTGTGFTPSGQKTADIYYRRTVLFSSVPAPCNTSAATLHITVRPQLLVGIVGADQSTCSGDPTLTMSETTAPTGGDGTYTYQWQSAPDIVGAPGTPGTFSNITTGGTGATYNAGALTNTTYYQLIESSCGESVTTNIVTKTISAPEVVTAVIDNSPSQVCASAASIVFTAAGSSSTGLGTLSYQWYLGPVSPANAVGTNSSTYTYTPVKTTDSGKQVNLVVTTSNVCNSGPGAATPYVLDIVGSVTPTVSISGNPVNCEFFPNVFTASSTGGGTSPGPSYQWFIDRVGPALPIAVGTGTTYSNSTLASGDKVYVEMTSSSTCLAAGVFNLFKSTEIVMDIKPMPAPSIVETDHEICTPNTLLLNGVVGLGTKLQWKLNGQNIPSATNATYTATQSGTYTLFEENVACNSNSQPMVLTIVQTPIANAGADVYMKEGDLGNLNGSGGSVYNWSPSTYLNDATASSPSFPATQTITYTLTVSAPSNPLCFTTADVTVFVVKPVKVPNVITVNGDGSNDDWEIENIEGYPNVIIEIYNRWGNLVWKTEGYPKNWDGTNFRNGQVLPDGTYFYIINLQSQVYDEPLTGWVQIIK